MIQCGISRQTKYHTLMCPQYLCLNFSTQMFRPADPGLSLSLFTSLLIFAAAFLCSRSETYPWIQWGNEMTVTGVGIKPAIGIVDFFLFVFVFISTTANCLLLTLKYSESKRVTWLDFLHQL